MRFWSKMFGRCTSAIQAKATRQSGSTTTMALTWRPRKRGAMNVCFSNESMGNAVSTNHSRYSCAEALPVNDPQWFRVLQAHVIAVQSNDRAVRFFREGRLDDAIAELGCGLEVSPRYATGHSNLGFLHLRKGQFDQAVACLLQALEVDPQHHDAPDHLVDVLSALIEELVQIGGRDGFLSTQPGGKFDDANRHMRTRAIGALVAKIGQHGIFKVGNRPLANGLLMEIVINAVAQKMGNPRYAISLKSAWSGIDGRDR